MSPAQQQRLCIWSGVAFFPLFGLGLGVAGWIPPPSPTMSAEATRRMFTEDTDRIRVGVWILTAAAPLLAMYVAAISFQIRQLAGPDSPLASAQLAAGACLILEFIFPQIIWQAAAYRPTARSAETIQTLNDVGWLLYIGVVGTAMLQMALCAIAILQDRRAQPLVPRWVAYVSLWTAVGVASGGLCVFAKTGPIAWNGLLSFWVLAAAFFAWMVSLTWAMLRATRLDPTEREATQRPTPKQSAAA